MPLIQEAFEIHAPPEQVFDLINDVEGTVDFSDFIQGIETIGKDTYRYKVSVAGIPLSWDTEVTERVRPVRISWKSLRGIKLKGSFELAPADFGSHVNFHMEYHIHNRFLALLLEPLLSPLIRKVAIEAVEEVKARIS
jgi:uncharacterized membrane protein